jgi:hypothetical protein
MQRNIRETGNLTATITIHSFTTNVSFQKQTSDSSQYINTPIFHKTAIELSPAPPPPQADKLPKSNMLSRY